MINIVSLCISALKKKESSSVKPSGSSVMPRSLQELRQAYKDAKLSNDPVDRGWCMCYEEFNSALIDYCKGLNKKK